MTVQVAPYGAWRSPITADLIVGGTVGLEQVALDGDDVYWIEARPAEAGRNVIVRRTPDGTISDCTPAPFNARTRVHEYGGASYTVHQGVVYFTHFADQRTYRLEKGSAPVPLTPAVDVRHADFSVDARRQRLIAIREDHTTGSAQPVNSVAVIPFAGGLGPVLASGHDFYSNPRVSPDGNRLAWLAWNHPNMPWDGTELWVADVNVDGTLGKSVRIAGGVDESIFQPEWSPDGVLHFVSDRSGWWNLYRWQDGQAKALAPMAAEFGKPLWYLGTTTYTFESEDRLLCSYGENGVAKLASLDTTNGALTTLAAAFTDVRGLKAADGKAVFVGGSPTAPLALVRLDLASGAIETLRRSSNVALDASDFSVPEPIEFPTENGLTAHAFYYPPLNKNFSAPQGDRPPLLVCSHGGPTGAASPTLRLEYQYWTSRGIAVVDVNYGGSTGYGRAYRQRLDDRWGIVDIDDCANAARFLVQRGQADEKRLAIRGGSAGGYTTLGALTFRNLFRAGASYYGVSDLEALAKDTHKFESRYLDRLVGAYPARRDLYVERSPIHFTERLSCPVILFQGLEDKVVPPSQAELMVDALKKKGLPVAYVPFEGEQHGFRRAENIKRALDGELYFYSRVFGFPLAVPVEPVVIANLP